MSQVIIPTLIDAFSEAKILGEQLLREFVDWSQSSNYWVDMFGDILDDSNIKVLYWKHFRYYNNPSVDIMVVRNCHFGLIRS